MDERRKCDVLSVIQTATYRKPFTALAPRLGGTRLSIDDDEVQTDQDLLLKKKRIIISLLIANGLDYSASRFV